MNYKYVHEKAKKEVLLCLILKRWTGFCKDM